MNLLNSESWTEEAEDPEAPLRSLFCTQYCKMPARFVGLALLTEGKPDVPIMLPIPGIFCIMLESCACAGAAYCAAAIMANETVNIIQLFFTFSTPAQFPVLYTIYSMNR